MHRNELCRVVIEESATIMQAGYKLDGRVWLPDKLGTFCFHHPITALGKILYLI
jgi:hypothetical protein